MKTLNRTIFWLLATTFLANAHAQLTVHEWGTFTAVHASDGTLLSGLEQEEHPLPNFVRSHAGFSPANKGWNRPVAGVTIKMETPVLYFYADHEIPVTVDVGFHGGSISQWYPERSGGEGLPALPDPITDMAQLQRLPPVDFGQGFTGSIQWKVTVLAPGDSAKITAPKEWETPQWPRARVGEANRVRTPDGAVEGFLFYRGIGQFDLPIGISINAQGHLLLSVKTMGIPFVWVYDNRPGVGGRYDWSGPLASGERREVPIIDPVKVDSGAERTLVLLAPLRAAGLSEAEARAMLATWKESYFDAPGLRVFWIVPRAFTDGILPLSITPSPDKLERVLVGRSEVLTPTFESELVDAFRRDGGQRWVRDRYFLAYRERARQLGVVLPENTP